MYYDQLKYMLHSEELCIDRIGFVIIIPYTCYSSYIRFPFIQEERNVSGGGGGLGAEVHKRGLGEEYFFHSIL